MIKINLLIEEDYIETFMNSLPKDKVKVIEENFEDNKEKLQKAFENYTKMPESCFELNESMKNINQWLKTKEQ